MVEDEFFVEEELEEEEEEWEKPRQNIGNEMGRGNTLETHEVSGILSDQEVLAIEIMSNRKLLAMLMALGSKPKNPRALVRKDIPQSTMYRLLRKLRDVGLVNQYKGIDFRKRYYKLTPLGLKVHDKIKEIIIEDVKRRAKETRDGYYRIEHDQLKDISDKLGIPMGFIIQWLNAEKRADSWVDRGGERYYKGVYYLFK